MAKIDKALLVAALALSLLGVLIGLDLLQAIGASPCGSPGAGDGCYPWGAQGPAAEYWAYQSKDHYIASSLFRTLVPFSVAGLLAFKRSKGVELSASLRWIAAIALAASLIPIVR